MSGSGWSGERDGRAPVVMRTFRGFSLSIAGDEVDLRAVKPRARTVLRMLAVHYPDWVHREVLIDAVWPDAEAVTGARNLHVAISTLRSALQPGSRRGGSLIVRQDHAYRLALPVDAWVDHVEFERELRRARAAFIGRDLTSLRTALSECLALAAGPLLPEDGPEEWVVPTRDHYLARVGHIAHALAELLLETGEPRAAVAVCERGLKADRWSDRLWMVLADAHEAAGDVLAAARVRREYAELLGRLGLPSGEGGATARRAADRDCTEREALPLWLI